MKGLIMKKLNKQPEQTNLDTQAIAEVLESDASPAAINTAALATISPNLARLAELNKRDELYQIKVATPIGAMTIAHYGKAPNLATIRKYLKLNYPQYASAKVEVTTFDDQEFTYIPDDQFPNPITQFGSIWEVEFTYTKFFFFRKSKTIRYIEVNSEKPVSLYNLLSPYRKALIKSMNVIGKVLPATLLSLNPINGAIINAKTAKRKH